MKSALEAAKEILLTSAMPISNLKLQKLLYYVQGWSLGLYGTPAFDDKIEAWVHGPVVPAAFYEYRHFRWNTIEIPSTEANLPGADKKHIKAVLDAYGGFTATQLERFSHDEAPWIQARGEMKPDDRSRTVISHRSMRGYFSQRANG